MKGYFTRLTFGLISIAILILVFELFNLEMVGFNYTFALLMAITSGWAGEYFWKRWRNKKKNQ